MPKVGKKKLKPQITSMRVVIVNYCGHCGSMVVIEKLMSGIQGECVKCRKPLKLKKSELLELLTEVSWRS